MIVASTSPAVPVAKAASSTIPIVFSMGGDPVRDSLVASLSQPGGNLTGVTTLNIELGPKRLELMHELIPTTLLEGRFAIRDAFCGGSVATIARAGENLAHESLEFLAIVPKTRGASIDLTS